MRILLVIEPSGGGSGRHVIDLAGALIRQGFAVTLIYSPLRAEPGFEAEAAALPFEALERLPMRRGVGPWDLGALCALVRLIRRLGPFDIVHGHSAKAGGLIRLVRVGGAAQIYTPHALPMMGPINARAVVAGVMEWLLARWARAAIVAVSDEEAALARRWRLSRARLHVVPNGLAAAPYRNRQAARLALDLPEDARVIGFVGRFRPQKDPIRFARAVRLARALDPRVIGVMIGDGDLTPAVRAAGGEALVLTGACEAGPLMAAFDLFAMTSRYEAGAYAMIEAATLGLPVVTTAVGGAEALRRAGAAIDILPSDAAPDRLARAMLAALERPGAPAPLSETFWSAARMAADTVQVYRHALARRRSGG